jgi:hypothetical protein
VEAVEHELLIPLSMKAHHASIRLDFQHPVLTKTVPAGLFKALANGGSGNGKGNNASAAKESEEHTCRIMRSQFSPCEIFKYISCPSLDDLFVPAILQNASQGQLVTYPS